MFLNSTVSGQIFMKFCEFLSIFVNLGRSDQKKEIILDIFQIDFVFFYSH